MESSFSTYPKLIKKYITEKKYVLNVSVVLYMRLRLVDGQGFWENESNQVGGCSCNQYWGASHKHQAFVCE